MLGIKLMTPYRRLRSINMIVIPMKPMATRVPISILRMFRAEIYENMTPGPTPRVDIDAGALSPSHVSPASTRSMRAREVRFSNVTEKRVADLSMLI